MFVTSGIGTSILPFRFIGTSRDRRHNPSIELVKAPAVNRSYFFAVGTDQISDY